ncbi:MAG: hypothetical protein ABIW76_09345, partial [Fibrobacteria bacterium]
WAGSHMVSHMAAYNGAEWDTLGGGLQNPLDNRLVDVNVLTKGPGGMYAGGSFQATRYGPALNVARWDGSSWHALGEGFAGSVYAILSSGTDMVVGGRSDPAPSLGSGALPTGHAIGRWSGTTWNAYGAGLKGAVHDLAEFKGGLYAAGRFHIMPDGPECGLAKWDGLNWTAVPYAGTDTLPMDSVYALTVFKDRLYAMGRETKWEYPWDEALMAWDGATWERVENISQGTDMVTDGKGLYIQCDVFDDRRDLGFVKAARFDGSNWILLGADAAQSDIRSLALHGEYLYLGGWLSKIGGVPGCWLARWNIQTLVSVRPKRIVEARKGEKTVRYLLLGDAASAGTDLYGLDGRKFRSTEEPAKHRLRAGPVVEVK